MQTGSSLQSVLWDSLTLQTSFALDVLCNLADLRHRCLRVYATHTLLQTVLCINAIYSPGQSYLPVRAGLVIRKANQLASLLALHSACGAG